jgi:hypothetical protein
MHILVSVLLFFVFCALLIVGLLQVLRDLLERDFYAPPSIAERAPGCSVRLDLDLPGDFDHPVGCEIEAVDVLRGVAVQEREKRDAPP